MSSAAKETECEITSADGLKLDGTICLPAKPIGAFIFVHGGAGMDRHEGGMFDQLSEILGRHSFASLRFDHRLFLASKDKTLELSIRGIANDISAAMQYVVTETSQARIYFCGSSFGGGAAALVASSTPELAGLVLINPLLDYYDRLLREKPFWKNGTLTPEGADELRCTGWLPHGDDIRMGRCLINEAASFEARLLMTRLHVPTLIVHGTEDRRIAHAASRTLADLLPMGSFQSIEGADHGIVEPGDESASSPRTAAYRRELYERVLDVTRA